MQLIQLALPEVLALVHFFTKVNAYGKRAKAQWLQISSLQVLPLNLEEQGFSAYSPVLSFLLQNNFKKKKKENVSNVPEKQGQAFIIFFNTFLISFLSSANWFVVTTRNQNFMSEHDGCKGAET